MITASALIAHATGLQAGPVQAGLLLPAELLQSDWFSVLGTFVAINTVIYVVLGIMKIIPVPQRAGHRGRSRRSETRSIHPDAPV